MNNCDIVYDLLPSYIDGLTRQSTNDFIEKHLEECPECKKSYEIMLEESKNIEVDEKKNIKFLAKIRRCYKLKMISLSLLLIIVFGSLIYIGNEKHIDIPKEQVKISEPYRLANGKICVRVDVKGISLNDENEKYMIINMGSRPLLEEDIDKSEQDVYFHFGFRMKILEYIFSKGSEDDILTYWIKYSLVEDQGCDPKSDKECSIRNVKRFYYENGEEKNLIWDSNMEVKDATKEIEEAVKLDYESRV